MNWSYIAGFTDGEGCIGCRQSGKWGFYYPVSLAQSGCEGLEVLREIATFLEKEGVTAKVYTRKAPLTGFSKRIQHSLYVGQRSSVEKFLRGVLPFLRVKRLKAQDALRMLTIYPMLPHGGNLCWESRRGNAIL